MVGVSDKKNDLTVELEMVSDIWALKFGIHTNCEFFLINYSMLLFVEMVVGVESVYFMVTKLICMLNVRENAFCMGLCIYAHA